LEVALDPRLLETSEVDEKRASLFSWNFTIAGAFASFWMPSRMNPGFTFALSAG
jgi:hypothetical protein